MIPHRGAKTYSMYIFLIYINKEIIHEKNTKEIIAVTRVYICDKTHVDFH